MNSPSNEFFDRLVRVLRTTIEREMRAVVLMLGREDTRPTGPHDSDAEQEILSALLSECTTIEALKPLESRHFYSHFNQKLFAVLSASAERDLQLVADALDMFGPVVDELETIKHATPFAVATTLHADMIIVMDRWHERELINTMQALDAELRVGALTVDDARVRLREFFRSAPSREHQPRRVE